MWVCDGIHDEIRPDILLPIHMLPYSETSDQDEDHIPDGTTDTKTIANHRSEARLSVVVFKKEAVLFESSTKA